MNQQLSMSRQAPEGRVLLLATMFVGLALILLPLATAARAASFSVNDTSDYADLEPGNGKCADTRTPPKCTLRAAIEESNARAGRDIISLKAASYKPTRKLPSITGPLVIQGVGAGRTAIYGSCSGSGTNPDTNECGASEFRVLHVAETGSLELDGVTIRNGQTGNGGGILNDGALHVLRSTVMRNHAHFNGGGIYNRGYLYMQDSTVNNNYAHLDAFGKGGGIYNDTNGYVDILYSTINHNRGVYGGGIHNGTQGQGGGTLVLLNSTISSNKATGVSSSTKGNSGGILNDGTGDAWLKSVTIAANITKGGGSGGVHGRGNFYFSNTLMVGNGSGSQVWSASAADCGGQVVSLGGNLVGAPGFPNGTKPDGTPKFPCDIVDWAPWPPDWPAKAADQIGRKTTEPDQYGSSGDRRAGCAGHRQTGPKQGEFFRLRPTAR